MDHLLGMLNLTVDFEDNILSIAGLSSYQSDTPLMLNVRDLEIWP